jgi:cytochrome P450
MAAELLVAGLDTSATTLTYALYHICSNPRINKKLTEELKKAMPTLDTTPVLPVLEQLPYLVRLFTGYGMEASSKLTEFAERLRERVTLVSVPCPWETASGRTRSQATHC